MTAEATPRIRLVTVPDAASLVVRGDGDDVRSDAIRFRRRFHEWNRFGVSGFLARDEDEIDVLGEIRLGRYARLVVFDRAALGRIGLEVVPTFRRPHVTIAHEDLEALVRGPETCEHGRVNGRYDAEGGGRP